VEREGAGAWVENTPAAVAHALGRIIESPALQASMGVAAKGLAARYAWPAIGQAMVEAYRRVLEGATVSRAG
jgi:hypothetical protein